MTKYLKWLVPGVVLSRLTFGYLDPGSGSFIIQILLAGFFGLLLSFKLFWQQITGLFKRKPAMPDASDADETDPAE